MLSRDGKGGRSLEKEYGKLTTDQFQRLIEKLPELRSGEAELRAILGRTSKAKLNELLGQDFNWGSVYELPFHQHVALLFLMFDGGKEYLKEVAALPDPQQRILDDIDKEPLETDPDQWRGGFGGVFTKAHLITLTYSLQRTVLSIMLFQRSMSGLVQEVRETGDLTALFNAVRVDRAAMMCPTIADRIAKAELVNDKHFFLRLRNALKGPQQKHWESYKDLRYSLAVLRQLGFDKLTDRQLEDLLVRQLKVYPATPSGAKNLRRQYDLSKKITTI